MTKRTRKLLINISILILLVGVTLLVLLLSYKELNFKNIAAFLRKSKGWAIAAAFGCMVLFIVLEGLAIKMIAGRLGHKTRTHRALAYSAADVYYSAITPSSTGGQPASLFYMMRDGMGAGTAGFTLILNLFSYSSAIVIMGVFALIASPGLFWKMGSGFARVLVILGFVFQVLLLSFFLICLLCSRVPRKAGNALIKLGAKLRIVRNPEKWHNKWNGVIEKYRGCREILRKHWVLIVPALLLNLAQRVAQTLIPCFICYAAAPNVSFYRLFIMQVFVLLGYNSLPLPGGVGAYEYLYLRTYSIYFNDAFILSAMMVSRGISFYCCLILSGLYTLIYHSVGLREHKGEQANAGVPESEPLAVQAGDDAAATLQEAVCDEEGESGQTNGTEEENTFTEERSDDGQNGERGI